MRRTLLFSFLLLSALSSFAQIRLSVLGGIANYQGDLIDKAFIGKLTKSAFGLYASKELSDKFSVRGGITFAKIAGYDKYNSKDYLQLRNLSFESNILEGSLVLDYSLLNMYNSRFSPYLFGGLAVFHYNPYAFNSDNAKVYLKPLSTEGQGLPQYPDMQPYSLTQFALPFGGGIKYALTDNIQVGLELGLRKLFTDYLDDISNNYVDAIDLFTEKGPLAVDLAYRGDEVPGGDPLYPAKGSQRGSNQYKDWYYITGLTLSFRLGNSGGGRTFGSNFRKGYGCPTNPN